MEALNAYNPQLNITIPTSGITNNTWLRMRISSDEVGSFGSYVLTTTAYVEVTAVNNVLSATCDPQTLSYCCEYGIYSVQLSTINNSSANAIEGYQDFSCQKQTDLTPGNSYLLDVRTGQDNPQDTKAWIDYNNDGVFDNTT